MRGIVIIAILSLVIVVVCLSVGRTVVTSIFIGGASVIVRLTTVCLHCGPRWFIVVVKCVRHGALPAGRALTWDALNQVLLDHAPLREVSHGGALLALIRTLEVSPIRAGRLKLSNSLLEGLFLSDQGLDLLKRIFTCKVFKNNQSLS